MRALEMREIVRIVDVRVANVLEFAEGVAHNMDVGNVEEGQLSIRIRRRGLKPSTSKSEKMEVSH